MSRAMNRTALSAALACAATLSPLLAHAAAPTVRLEPAEVAPGEPATMVVETEGAAAPPHIPALPGLDVQPIGQQTQLTIVNGQRTDSTSYLYRVSSDARGDLVIDGITVDGARAAPVTLHVDSAASPAAGRSVASGHAPQPSLADAASDDGGDRDAARAFLRLRLGKRKVYAGERVPFTVQAYFRAGTGVTVSAAPKFSDDSLIVSGLDKEPKQVETTIDGERYLAVTWRGELTAAKDGPIPAEVSLPTTLQFVEASAPTGPRRSLRDLFAGSFPMSAMMQDPLFDALLDGSMMDLAEPGRVVSRDITLHGKSKSLEVLPLPSEGRPADFQGAIGRFELRTELARTELTQGEPVDVQIELTGEGNFGRFALPALSSSADFRAYSAANARPEDAATAPGRLTSKQPIAALRAGALEVPPVRFSYFDPALGKYVTTSSEPISVQVAPSAGGAAEQVAPSPRVTGASDAEGPVVTTLTRGGVPAWLFPTALACLLVSLFAAATLRFRSSAYYASAEGALRTRFVVRRHRAAMRRAAAARDGGRVVRAGSDDVRAKLARAWRVPSASITAHEVATRLPDAPRPIVELLELADEADYAGRPPRVPPHFDLRAWTSELDRHIANLEPST